MPEGYEMRRVDRAFFEDCRNLRHFEHVHRWASSSFGSVDGLLASGFGFCLLAEGVIASHCIADCVAGDRAEMGIHTDEAFRRRGLATLTAATAVRHCLDHGVTEIGWRCHRVNRASAATARRIGFGKAMDYFAYEVRAGQE